MDSNIEVRRIPSGQWRIIGPHKAVHVTAGFV